jgi:hypothetical protein
MAEAVLTRPADVDEGSTRLPSTEKIRLLSLGDDVICTDTGTTVLAASVAIVRAHGAMGGTRTRVLRTDMVAKEADKHLRPTALIINGLG